MFNVYQASVDLHRKHRGKLAVKSKVDLKTKDDLALAYTPGVAEVCRVIDADKSELNKLTCRGNLVAVITDGSAILGLGNLGPEAAMPVMEGKCLLFKEFADVDAVPICLATQDTEEIIKTIKYLEPTFAGINLEDIAAPRCFEIERRLKAELTIPVMHDDQHGTAVVVLAGLINALKLKNISSTDIEIVINGAGAAGTAIADLLAKYGFSKIVVCDSKGAIHINREDLNKEKLSIAKTTNPQNKRGELIEIIRDADVFIGVSAPDILTEAMVKTMKLQPIIFALANPQPEIMPDLARAAGAFIVATGRSDFANQINNVLVFPGIFRGALDNQVKQITDEILVRAAVALADYVTDLSVDKILPSPLDKAVSGIIAKAVY